MEDVKKIANYLKSEVIQAAKSADEWVTIFMKYKKHGKEEYSKEKWYAKKIDSTHLYLTLNKNHPPATHVAQWKNNKKLYDDLVKWLHGSLNIEGKTYLEA